MNIDAIRKDFPILGQRVHGRELVYLDNAATTHKPRQVLDRVTAYYTQCNSNIHRGVHTLSERASGLYEGVRETVRSFIGAGSTVEVLFTAGTTASINLVADAFGRAYVRGGDEIVVTQMEHHSNFVPWQMMCERCGAILKMAPVDAHGVLAMESLERMLTDRTRLLAVTHVSNAMGTVNDIKRIIDAAHARGVAVLVDAAQSVPHLPVDVGALDCDFLAFSGHKLYAETGVGVLYGKRQWLERMPPYQTGGGMIDRVTPEKTTYIDLPLKFEAGTGNIAGVISLGAAIEYVRSVGFDSIAAHENALVEEAVDRLAVIDGVRVYGQGRRCGIVSFNLEGVHPYDVGMILDKLGIAVRTGHHCAQPLMDRLGVSGTVRAGFGLYNRPESVDHLVAGLLKARDMLGSKQVNV